MLEEPMKWTFWPGAKATYCGVMVTEPWLMATGGGWAGEDTGGGGSVPCVTPQPAARRPRERVSASGMPCACGIFTGLLRTLALTGVGGSKREDQVWIYNRRRDVLRRRKKSISPRNGYRRRSGGG